MPQPLRDDRGTLVVRRPGSGITVARFTGNRPLMRGVPDHFGTAMQLAGHSRWTVDGVPWSSAPGTVAIKAPGELTVERARHGTLDLQVVVFETALVDEARDALRRPNAELRTPAIDPADPRARPLISLHHHLLEDEPGDEAIEQLTCDAVHALVDIAFSPHGPAPNRPRFSAAVVRARALLDQHFTETIALDTLATHARLDKFRLCRAFREQLGLPPHAYVTYRRIALAQSLLARGIPQAEVAARVGFYDQSLLHRHFKRIVRLTPGAFARAPAAR